MINTFQIQCPNTTVSYLKYFNIYMPPGTTWPDENRAITNKRQQSTAAACCGVWSAALESVSVLRKKDLTVNATQHQIPILANERLQHQDQGAKE